MTTSERLRRLDDALDVLVACFHEQAFPQQSPPGLLWHYTSAEGLRRILGSGRLWLANARTMPDTTEIRYGNALLRETASELLTQTEHDSLSMLLHDRRATLFCAEDDMYMCCFTEAADCGRQWARAAAVRAGGALVFDSARLERTVRPQLQCSGLVRVEYDPEAVHSSVTSFLRSIIEVTPAAHLESEEEVKLVAQFMQEIGVLSFFTKHPRWRWEREWRIVKRTTLSRPPVVQDPRPHLEVDLRRDEHPLVAVCLGPRCSQRDEAAVLQLVDDRWNGIQLLRSGWRRPSD